ncbi:hypothetical protein Peur_033513 [Populus x canadensis]
MIHYQSQHLTMTWRSMQLGQKTRLRSMIHAFSTWRTSQSMILNCQPTFPRRTASFPIIMYCMQQVIIMKAWDVVTTKHLLMQVVFILSMHFLLLPLVKRLQIEPFHRGHLHARTFRQS